MRGGRYNAMDGLVLWHHLKSSSALGPYFTHVRTAIDAVVGCQGSNVSGYDVK